jgi:[protein-PII] uridylyltransferase
MSPEREVGHLRRKLREGRTKLFPPSARTAPCRELLEAHTALVDELVQEVYSISCDHARQQAPPGPNSGLAIAGTGSYGRRELSPFSEEGDPWVEAAVHVAFKLVMDVFLSLREIRVGYSYRPVEEASTWDLPTRTALLDARHVCGERKLTEMLSASLRRHLSPLDLVLEFRTQGERQLRQPSGSQYNVEPNLKEGPGSLRDLHRARWIYKLLLRVDDQTLLGELQDRGYLPAQRITEIRHAAEWFWRARNWLHLTTKKHSDVLINNYQDRIARDLSEMSAQEWLMQHFAHAEILELFREAAVRHTFAGPLDLGDARLENGSLRLAQGAGRERAAASVSLLQLSQHYGVPVALQEMQALEDRRDDALLATEPSSEESWVFLNILREGKQVAPTLRGLVRTGLIDRFIGGFSRTMRYVPADPAHRYTVGEHSIKIVEYLEDLLHGADPSASRFSDLIARCTHFDVLCLAALIHDAGKLMPGTDHCETAGLIAGRVGARLNLAPEKQEMLDLLVRNHILLVRTARLQDLKSAHVIQDVARKIGTVDVLRHLYVFTYADTRAVSEDNWTSMDNRDLEDLYQRVQSCLIGEGQAADGSSAVEVRLGSIRRKLARFKDPEEEAVLQHCSLMPASYVLNNSLDEIAVHVRLLKRLKDEQVVLDFYNRPGDTYSELTVCTYDDPKPGMLARIAGVLYGCGVDIYKAQVFTIETERPVVLDVLWVTSAGTQISENRARRIDSALKEVLSGRIRIEEFLKRAGKQPPRSVPLDSIDLRNDLSEEHTVVHVIARDLQGLLYLMTRALSRSGLNIHSARVATWNARAENNFYVTSVTGGQIPEQDLPVWKEQLTRILCGSEAE